MFWKDVRISQGFVDEIMQSWVSSVPLSALPLALYAAGVKEMALAERGDVD
jgi:hypothetical protein